MSSITQNLKLKIQKGKATKFFQQRSGQAILIVVLVIGATMLGVSTIAGYVSLQKIRTGTDIVDSTKAIYAADTGVEWCLYQKFGPPNNGTSTPPCELDNMQLGNNASVSVVESADGTEIKSIGKANRASRAFGIFLGALGL